MDCDTYLFLSFHSEKDRSLSEFIFMIFLKSLSYFISLYQSFWVYHSSMPGKFLHGAVSNATSNYGLCISFLLDFS
jgi:hypothetical protein